MEVIDSRSFSHYRWNSATSRLGRAGFSCITEDNVEDENQIEEEEKGDEREEEGESGGS